MKFFLNLLFKIIIIFITPFSIRSCSHDFEGAPVAGQAFVVSVSSDGEYAISSNGNKKVILWDIQHKTHETVSTDGNIYSVYFIKKTHDFLWQDDKTNDVFVENVDEKILNTLHPGFPTYGEVMTSDLKHYIASNEAWALYEGTPNNIRQIKYGNDHGGFEGSGKLLNLSLSDNNKYLVTSGYSGNQGDDLPLSRGLTAKDVNPEIPDGANFSIIDGVTLWDVDSEKPLNKFSDDEAKTIATLSPNGNFVVSGDEDTLGYVWQAQNGKKVFDLASLRFGIDHKIGPKDTDYYFDKTGLITQPKDFLTKDGLYSEYIISLKFIDDQHYLRFTTRVPYAVLYSIKDPRPQKYLPLGRYPWPSVNDYSMDEAIDTAPAANILVMGQNDGPGIIVYKYHPATQTLEKIWAPGADTSHLIKITLINFILGLLIAYGLLAWEKGLRNYFITPIILLLIYTPFGFFYYYDWGISVGSCGIILGIILAIVLLRKFPYNFLLHRNIKIN